MKRFILLVLTSFLIACGPVATVSDDKTGWTPQSNYGIARPEGQFQHVEEATVYFRPSKEMTDRCVAWGATRPKEGTLIVACAREDQKAMLLPNPCEFDDYYAQLVCHEAAHTVGWSDPE